MTSRPRWPAPTLVVERELITNRHGGNPIECRAGVALCEPADRRLTFWSGTQVPHLVRNMIAELLDLPEGNVRVIAPDVGGGFGVKSVLYPEDVALCLIARAMPGVPVKWVEDRVEHLLAATHARDHRYRAAGPASPPTARCSPSTPTSPATSARTRSTRGPPASSR